MLLTTSERKQLSKTVHNKNKQCGKQFAD